MSEPKTEAIERFLDESDNHLDQTDARAELAALRAQLEPMPCGHPRVMLEERHTDSYACWKGKSDPCPGCEMVCRACAELEALQRRVVEACLVALRLRFKEDYRATTHFTASEMAIGTIEELANSAELRKGKG